MRSKPVISEWLSLIGATLSFAGGCFLTYDAFTIRKRIKAEAGLKSITEELNRLGCPDGLSEKDGTKFGSKMAIDLWLAVDSLTYTKTGFSLVTVGFVLDAVSRVGNLLHH
jgi:hypothetical protein